MLARLLPAALPLCILLTGCGSSDDRPLEVAVIADSGANAARLSLLEWGRTYLGGHFTLPPSAMHRWLGERLDALHKTRGVKLNVIGSVVSSSRLTSAWLVVP